MNFVSYLLLAVIALGAWLAIRTYRKAGSCSCGSKCRGCSGNCGCCKKG